MAQERCEELEAFEDALEQPQYALGRAAQDIRGMGRGPREQTAVGAPWLQRHEPTPTTFLADTGNELFPHLPDTSWDVLATFHRRM